jgi:hypothetical protein
MCYVACIRLKLLEIRPEFVHVSPDQAEAVIEASCEVVQRALQAQDAQGPAPAAAGHILLGCGERDLFD